MPRALIILADGFEEIEAITPIDVLRRAGVEVVVAGLGGTTITGAHGIMVQTDVTVADAKPSGLDAIILPGGLPGAQNLKDSPEVQALITAVHGAGQRVAAICAAPALALAPSGVLSGRQATCYPGFEHHFAPDVTPTEDRVVTDGPVTTSRGPGTALEFALALVEQLVDAPTANRLRQGMLVAEGK